MSKMIVVDETRCLACKTCVLECAMAHTEARTLAEAVTGAFDVQPRVHVEAIDGLGMPMQCRHCEDAPCITVCPTRAIYRASPLGPVLLDPDRCIGCRSCMLVCPFGVIDMARDGKCVTKCDLCIERTAAGEEPACVAGCPTGALQYCEVDEWLARRRREAAWRVAAGERSEKPDGPEEG